MDIVKFAQEKARLILLLFAFVVIAGVYATIQIPKESEPDIKIPILYVVVQQNGISAEDSINLLVKPLEREVRSIEGIKKISSNGFESGGSVVMEFKAGFDAKKALSDVREAVNKAKVSFPSDAREPSIFEVNLSLFPVLSILLYGNVDERVLIKAARELKDGIRNIPQVLSADIVGDRDQLAEIIVMPQKIEEYNITADELISSLAGANILIPAGALENGSGRFALKVPSLINNPQELKSIPVKKFRDKVVTLGDITELRYGFRDAVSMARVDGQPAVAVQVVKRTGENIIETIERVKLVLDEATKRLPSSIKIQTIQDKSSHIRHLLTELTNNIVSAVILVVSVILAFLGFRSGVLVALSVPGSFFGGVLALYISGYSVNIVVLFTLILSVGMLVDDAIVVAEYAARRIGQGMRHKDAYYEASTRMAAPVITSTLTKILVFLPLLFWPGIVGQFIRFMPITLIAVLTASLIFALVFVPVLGTHLNHLKRMTVYFFIALLLGTAGNEFFGAAGVAVGLALAAGLIYWAGKKYPTKDETHETEAHSMTEDEQEQPLPTRGIAGFYLGLLEKIALRPYLTMLCAFILLAISYISYGNYGRGVEFFPNIEPERFLVSVSARGNLSIQDKFTAMRRIESEVSEFSKEYNGISAALTIVGTTGQGGADDNIGQVQIELTNWKERPQALVLMEKMRERLSKIGGVSIEVSGEKSGPTQNKPITVEISGSDRAQTQAQAEKLLKIMKEDANLTNISSNLPIPKFNWELKVDRTEAAKMNISIGLIGTFVQLVTQGVKGSVIHPNDTDKEVDVVVRYPADYRNLDSLDKIRIQTPAGSVPLSQVVTRQPVQDSGVIRRINEKFAFKLEADPVNGVLPTSAIQQLDKIFKDVKLADDVRYQFTGEQEDQKESQAFLSKAFLVAIFMIALLMLLEFNSFSTCLFILTSVIMSSAGVLLGLLIMGQPFGIVMSGIGVVALAGIVVNNNIVLLDTYDHLRARGVEPILAIKTAGYQRFRPVFLTSLCTVLGLIPIVAAVNIDFVHRLVDVGGPGTQWWVQLSTAIAAGMTFATPFTLLVTPAMVIIRERMLGLVPIQRKGIISKMVGKLRRKAEPVA